VNDPATAPFPGAADYPEVTGLGGLLPIQIARRASATALQMANGESWSWKRLGSEVARIQAGFAARGIAEGDKVALFCENSLRMAAAILAIAGYGALSVPLNTGLVGRGLETLLTHSEAKLLILDPEYEERCLATGIIPAGRCVSTGAGARAANWADAFGTDGPLLARGAGADIAIIMYTSGTTGESKGAMLSHRCCLLAAWASAAVMFEAAPGEVIYTALPLYHCAAQQLGLWTAALSGASLVLAPRFSASAFWRHMREYGVKAFHFVGPITSVLWKAPPSPEDRDHPVRLGVGGGPRIAWREFEERFGLTFVECYGMTETFGGCVTHRPAHARSGKAGKALWYVDMKVVDENGAVCPPDMRGRVLLRAKVPDAFFSGYYNRPDLTAAAFQDGWYNTGDLGSMDADGYITWHSRLRDIIRRKGENVSAITVENTIAEHPAVAECGVTAVPAELGEDEILAVVVPRDGAVDIAEIVAFAQLHLPPFAVPRYFAVAGTLPKTATSRLQRHLLIPLLDRAYDRLAKPARPNA
jgi:crotonobetaine/carnitine-CoA ligase